jgi:DNA-binding Lrp family transcriptional regulator
MADQIQAGPRQIQILRALQDNGPLSLATLEKLLTPQISRRRLQDATKRMADQGLIVRRFDSLPSNVGHYYQLSGRQANRERIAQILNCDEGTLSIHPFRTQELQHTQCCAIWANRLQHLFPGAQILRDFDFKRHAIAGQYLLSSGEDFELRPDLLIVLPHADSKSQVVVAIEIERTRKSNKRLLQKLRSLCTRTRLDGVLYLCDKNTIETALRTIYCSNVVQKAHRIRHYGNNFLLLSDGTQTHSDPEPRVYNVSQNSVSLTSWMNLLLTTQPRERRDSAFDQAAQPR